VVVAASFSNKRVAVLNLILQCA